MKDIFGKEVTKEIIEKEMIDNNIGDIIAKYSKLYEEMSIKNNPRYIKVAKEELALLKSDYDDVAISEEIEGLFISSEFAKEFIHDIKRFGASHEKLEEIQIKLFLANTTAKLIYDKYDNLLKNKNIEKDEYFSNTDYVKITEIYELAERYEVFIEEICCIVEEIKEQQNLSEEDIEGIGESFFECLDNILRCFYWIFINR